MKLPEQVMELMGKEVDYCRAKLDEQKGVAVLHKGSGVIVGIIIGASRRVQIMVKDESESKDKAWTLDLLCINPTKQDADRYFEHHTKLQKLVSEHNQAQKDREQEKIKEVDTLNAAFFGDPLDV
jgi:hypothetical protein